MTIIKKYIHLIVFQSAEQIEEFFPILIAVISSYKHPPIGSLFVVMDTRGKTQSNERPQSICYC